jgi:hypothetical protein
MQETVTDAADITFTAQEIRMYNTAVGRLNGQGVLNPANLAVTQRGAGANFSVDVAAGIAGVIGDDITNQGIYYAWNDATVNVVTPSAPVSGTRVHRLVAQIRDKLSNGTFTTYDWQLQLLPDVGGGTPAEPNSAVTLALISIAAGQASVTNANISDQRTVWNDTWRSLAGLQSNGWSITGNDLPFSGYRRRPGDPTIMEFMAVYATGTITNGEVVSTLAVPYRVSQSSQRLACGTAGATTENNTPHLAFNADGTITIEDCDADTTTIYVNGAVRLT